MIFQLLDIAKEIFNNQLIDTQSMLAQLSDEAYPTPPVENKVENKE